jgi:hypothetical protein
MLAATICTITPRTPFRNALGHKENFVSVEATKKMGAGCSTGNRIGFQDWLRNSLDWQTSCSKAATRFSSSSIGLVLIASSHITIVRHNRDIKLSRSANCMFSFIGTSITVRALFGNLAKRGIFHDPGIGEDDIELAAVFFDLRENAIELVELRDVAF